MGAVFAIFVAGLVVFQDRLLYFPTRAPLSDVTASLAAWPDPQDFRGLLAEPGHEDHAAGRRGTAVVFHGNAGHAGHRLHYARALTDLGLRVILAEYPGYGARAGTPGEQALVADAQRTISLAAERHGEPLLVVGESLGAAVAASAAARQAEQVAGLLLITPWDRLESVAGHHYPWLPVGWLLRDRYDTVENLRHFERPVVIVLADEDEIVPARLGRTLHEGLGRKSRLVTIPGAGHNDWPTAVDATWWRSTLAPLLNGTGQPRRPGGDSPQPERR